MAEAFVSTESRFIKFSLLVLFAIVSMLCICYILYHVLRYPIIRQRFHNQTLIVLVVLVALNTTFNIPTAFSFYARGHVLLDQKNFCLAWQIIDCIFTAVIVWCEAIFTIERHVLIFHPRYLRSQRQKILFHHLPLIFIGLYLILFYVLVSLVGTCVPENTRYDRNLCGEQCVEQPSELSIFDWAFNILFPAFVVIFGSITLLLRVLWKRREMQRNLRNWSKNWKMIIQLLSIAIVYTIVWFPFLIISLISTVNPASKTTETTVDHFEFLVYLSEMAVPVVALFFWPELMRRLRRGLTTNSIAPVTMGPYSTN